MARALKTAALVVGAVALVATGIGAAAGVGIGLGLTAGTLGTIASVAAIAGVASGVLSVAAGLTAKKPTAQATGSQTQFAADPDAGIPLAIGRTGTAGNIVARFGWDTRDAGDNDREAFVSVLSLGPVQEVEPALGVDRVPVYFDGQGRAIGGFAGFMWRTTQVGLLASAALTFGAGAGTPPAWGPQHALSGKAATTWTLRFDTKSKLYQNREPAPMNVVKGQFCYDPRKDSTYPGGSGSHRMADPADRAAYDAAVATWEFSECPFLNGLRFVHGYWQRDMANPSSDWQRVMGMGAPLAGIDLASFVEGANVAEANGWKAGGVIFSGDDKWASLKAILQAGMGEPLALGAKISCLVNAPKVSLATITEDDVVGECSVGATQPRRDRVNTITPKFRLEENGWQLLPGAPISVAEHVAADRGKRSRAQEYRMIQSASLAGTAVRYDIENAREFGPIVLPCKLFWMGYKPGDCVTANLPEVGLNGQPILLLNRGLAASSGIVTLTARSETPGKHAFALGQTATPPPTPGVTGAPIVPVPGVDAWAVTGGSVAADGVTLAALTITGTVTASAVDGVIFDYRPFVSGQADEAGWIGAGTEAVDVTRKIVTGVRDLAPYEVSVRYSARGFSSGRRVLGPVTTGAATVSWGDGVVGNGKPADNATDSRDPASPFGPDGTVGDALGQLVSIDRAIAAAKAREDVLVNETIPAIDRAVEDAGGRIADARGIADQARIDIDAEIERARGAEGHLNERIDSVVAEGGYDDTAVYAEISRVDQTAINRDTAIARSVERVESKSAAGNLVRKPTFEDGQPGSWPVGQFESRIIKPADYGQPVPPSGGFVYLMRGLRDALEGDVWIKGAWGGRKLRVTGYASSQFSSADSAVGVFARAADGRVDFPNIRAAVAGVAGYSRFDGVISLAGDIVEVIPWLQNNTAPGTESAEVRLHSLMIADATQAQENAATIEARYDTLAESDRVFAEQARLIEASLATVDNRIAASASDVTRTYTDADLALSTRSTALEGSAANASTGIVRNDAFNVWTHPQPMPASWAVWVAQGNFSVERGVPGRAGQFYVRTRNDAGGVDSGFYQTIASPGAGKWVVDVTVASESNGLNGAGVTLHGIWNLDFCGDPDTTGRIGDSAPGEVRSWSKMFDLDGRDQINVHAMHGWSGFGRTIVPKYMTWHRLSVRPATDGEIKAGKADAALNNPGGVLAKMTGYDATLADLPNRYAATSSLSTLEAQVNFAADSGLQRTLRAAIEDRATAIADSKAGAVAETVRVLRGEYDGTVGEVRDQRGVLNGLNGKTAAYVRIIADAGNGRAALSLWSDQYGGAWQLTGNGAIDGNLTINGTITALAFNGPTMFREGQASWSGNVSPSPGQTLPVGWSLGLPTIPAGRGRFIYEFTFEMTTNAGTVEYGGLDGQGRTVRTYYVADGGGLILQAVDGQGNAYTVRPNASDRILATTDFAPTFTASVRRGSRDETQDGGDYVNHYVAATYTLTSISLKVTWLAI